MLPADLKAVAEVEKSAYDYPWSHGIFRDCLLAGYYCLVLDVVGTLTGYGIMSVAAAEAHILNLCIHPSLQRQGYGRRLLTTIMVKAEELEVHRIFLEVRPSNRAALGLYKAAGFDRVGIRPSYYQADYDREDAVVLALMLRSSD